MSNCAPCSPCANQPTPTDCEPLPSALNNFITHFFGVMTKTVAEDGTVSWNLPCNLANGIEGNPRLENEGIACYLVRLFSSGLDGLQGEQGDPGVQGDPGPAGVSAFTTTAANFTQPSVGGSVAILLADATWLTDGMIIFVQGAGYFTILGIVGSTVTAQLLDSTGAVGTITSGKDVVSGGLKGPAGDDGADGTNGTDGDDGTDGAPGGEWTVGSAVPDDMNGVDGDMYLRTTTGDVYRKTGGTWVFACNIQGASSSKTVNVQTGTTYTPVIGDKNNAVTLDNAAGITFTVPTNLSVAFPVGTEIDLIQLGAGQVTVVPAGTVTVNGLGGATKISAQHGRAKLIKVATNTWNFSGNIST